MNKALAIFTSLAAVLLSWQRQSSAAFAQQDYKTPQDAVDALVATAKSGDEKAALVVLGADGQDIISSGDKVSDDAVRARFVASYDAKHQIAMDGDQRGDSHHRRQRLSVPDPAASATRTAPGRSTPMPDAMKSWRAASAITNSTPSRPASLMSMRKTITRRRIAARGRALRAALHQHGG